MLYFLGTDYEVSNVLDGGFIKPIVRYIQRIISQTVSLPRAEINYPASQEDCKVPNAAGGEICRLRKRRFPAGFWWAATW